MYTWLCKISKVKKVVTCSWSTSSIRKHIKQPKKRQSIFQLNPFLNHSRLAKLWIFSFFFFAQYLSNGTRKKPADSARSLKKILYIFYFFINFFQTICCGMNRCGISKWWSYASSSSITPLLSFVYLKMCSPRAEQTDSSIEWYMNLNQKWSSDFKLQVCIITHSSVTSKLKRNIFFPSNQWITIIFSDSVQSVIEGSRVVVVILEESCPPNW